MHGPRLANSKYLLNKIKTKIATQSMHLPVSVPKDHDCSSFRPEMDRDTAPRVGLAQEAQNNAAPCPSRNRPTSVSELVLLQASVMFWPLHQTQAPSCFLLANPIMPFCVPLTSQITGGFPDQQWNPFPPLSEVLLLEFRLARLEACWGQELCLTSL